MVRRHQEVFHSRAGPGRRGFITALIPDASIIFAGFLLAGSRATSIPAGSSGNRKALGSSIRPWRRPVAEFRSQRSAQGMTLPSRQVCNRRLPKPSLLEAPILEIEVSGYWNFSFSRSGAVVYPPAPALLLSFSATRATVGDSSHPAICAWHQIPCASRYFDRSARDPASRLDS
jgi:hypothetical protein